MVELNGSSAGSATVTATSRLSTFAQTARTSAQVAAWSATTTKARNSRTSAQVATHTATTTTARSARVSVQVAVFYPPPEGYADGVALVTGTLTNLSAIKEISGSSSGTSTVTGALGQIIKASGLADGLSTVTAHLWHLDEVTGASGGTSSVAGHLTQVQELGSSPAGVATVTGELWYPFQNLYGTSAGSASIGLALLTETGPHTFSTAGHTAWVVPETVTEITVSAWGGGGGGGATTTYPTSDPAGRGGAGDGGGCGYAKSVLSVTPLETLDVYVGGGGGGGDSLSDGGGGGGYSSVKRSGSGLIVAGGGAGGGGGSNKWLAGGRGGVGGGLNGGDGANGTAYYGTPGGGGGTGGGQTVNGIGGTGALNAGSDGSSWQGGEGGNTNLSSPTTGGGPAGGENGGGDAGYGKDSGLYRRAGGGGAGGGIRGGGGGGNGGDSITEAGGGGGGGGANTFTGTDQYGETGIQRAPGGVLGDGYPGTPTGYGGRGGANNGLDSKWGTDGISGAVYIEWDIMWSPASNPAGVASVSGTLDRLTTRHILDPIPYDLSINSADVHRLEGSSAGSGTVNPYLNLINDMVAGSDGLATVTGALTNYDPIVMEGTSDGTSLVLGTLQNGSGGSYPVELEGRSDGVGHVGSVWSLRTGTDIYTTRHLYLYVNVGVGYVGDTYNGGGGTVVSYSEPDGDPTTDWDRHLCQFVNVGVDFDDTDSVLTRAVGSINSEASFVSQTYSDGNIRDDWDRHLYQFLQVIEKVESPGRLTIGPAPTRPTFLPPAKPPVSRVGRGPEVV